MFRSRIFLAAALALATTACATDDYGYGGYGNRPSGYGDRDGGYSQCRDYGCRYKGDRDYRRERTTEDDLGERSNYKLDPWLAYTSEGQIFVLSRFDHNRNRRISESDAKKSNKSFRRFADRNRDFWVTDQEIDAALQELTNRRLQRQGQRRGFGPNGGAY